MRNFLASLWSHKFLWVTWGLGTQPGLGELLFPHWATWLEWRARWRLSSDSTSPASVIGWSLGMLLRTGPIITLQSLVVSPGLASQWLCPGSFFLEILEALFSLWSQGFGGLKPQEGITTRGRTKRRESRDSWRHGILGTILYISFKCLRRWELDFCHLTSKYSDECRQRFANTMYCFLRK